MARLRVPRLQAAGLQVTITGRDFDRAQRAADELGATAVEYAEASSATADCVLVTSASQDHLPDLQNFLPDAPIVLCEKPVATSVGEASQLLELVAASGTEVYVGFQRRFDPGAAALRQRVLNGDLGGLLHVRATDFDHEPGSREFIAKSGGMFKDLVIHDIDWIKWTTGLGIASVHASGSALTRDYRELDDCDIATVSLVLQNGTLATVNSSRAHPLGQDVRLELLGSRGAISVGLTRSTPLEALEGSAAVGLETPPQDFMDRFAEAFRRETDHFARYATGQSTTFAGCTLDEAINALIVAEACESSWRSGQPLSLSPVGRKETANPSQRSFPS